MSKKIKINTRQSNLIVRVLVRLLCFQAPQRMKLSGLSNHEANLKVNYTHETKRPNVNHNKTINLLPWDIRDVSYTVECVLFLSNDCSLKFDCSSLNHHALNKTETHVQLRMLGQCFERSHWMLDSHWSRSVISAPNTQTNACTDNVILPSYKPSSDVLMNFSADKTNPLYSISVGILGKGYHWLQPHPHTSSILTWTLFQQKPFCLPPQAYHCPYLYSSSAPHVKIQLGWLIVGWLLAQMLLQPVMLHIQTCAPQQYNISVTKDISEGQPSRLDFSQWGQLLKQAGLAAVFPSFW